MSFNASNFCLNNNESKESMLSLLNKLNEISERGNNTVYWQSNETLRYIQKKYRVLHCHLASKVSSMFVST